MLARALRKLFALEEEGSDAAAEPADDPGAQTPEEQ